MKTQSETLPSTSTATRESGVVPAVPLSTASSARAATTAAPQHPLQLSYELRDFTRFPVAPLLEQGNPALYAQCLDIIGRAREHAERNLLGKVEAWDVQAGRDHDFAPWSVLKAGSQYGFLGMNVPNVFGGGNFGPLAAGVFAEEIASADAGVFVIYGAHALALSLILSALDLRMVARLGREITDGEKRSEPVLLALAHTEVGGGSDVEDVDDIKHARLGSRYQRVPGGYRLNCRKVFISNGSYAKYNVVTAYADPNRPIETMMGFIVPANAAGFSVGRLEHKLGQRLSSAVEIICEDVFVPDADAVGVPDGARCIDSALSLTRGPVGGMSTGIIRGTLERTLRYLAQKRVRGHWLFEEQWVQLLLADMVGALQAARGLYIDASLAGEHWGLGMFMRGMPRQLTALVGKARLFDGIASHPRITEQAREMYRKQVPTAQLQRIVAHASIAKFMCSDMAVATSMKAMEILGEDANDPAWGVEKGMRDAKLAQIFEGTNQINRLHVARGVLRRA